LQGVFIEKFPLKIKARKTTLKVTYKEYREIPSSTPTGMLTY